MIKTIVYFVLDFNSFSWSKSKLTGLWQKFEFVYKIQSVYHNVQRYQSKTQLFLDQLIWTGTLVPENYHSLILGYSPFTIGRYILWALVPPPLRHLVLVCVGGWLVVVGIFPISAWIIFLPITLTPGPWTVHGRESP